MSTATYQAEDPLTWVKVNGRKVFVNRITQLHQIGPARWVGVASQRPFEIACESNGQDWLVQWDAISSAALRCPSIVAAIHTIENA